jgi:fatty acid desaturase
MYVCDLGLLSSYEQRIVHAISHHCYSNTISDYGVAMVEPVLDYRVYATKSLWYRYRLSLVFSFIILPLALFGELIKRIVSISIGHQELRFENLFPLFQLVAMRFLISLDGGWTSAFLLWFAMHAGCSFTLICTEILMGNHHHPNFYHPGDGEFSYGLDWGLAQLDTTGDNTLVTGPSFFVEVLFIGNHVVHHMFPTLDHGLLEFVRPVVQKTACEFNLPEHLIKSLNAYSPWEIAAGNFRQMARTKVRSVLQKKLKL